MLREKEQKPMQPVKSNIVPFYKPVLIKAIINLLGKILIPILVQGRLKIMIMRNKNPIHVVAMNMRSF